MLIDRTSLAISQNAVSEDMNGHTKRTTLADSQEPVLASEDASLTTITDEYADSASQAVPKSTEPSRHKRKGSATNYADVLRRGLSFGRSFAGEDHPNALFSRLKGMHRCRR